MTRAEERALEAYPYDYPERTGFRQGYEQAEKDLVFEFQRRHDGYKVALEKEKDPRSKHAVDLIARIREDSQLIELINSLPEEDTTEDLNELIQKWDRVDINTVLKVKVKATGKVIDGFYDGRGHFDHFIDHDVFDRYSIDEVELMPHEEPSKELEKEIDRYLEPIHVTDIQFEPFTQMAKCARHFAEWGAKSVFNGDIKFR